MAGIERHDPKIAQHISLINVKIDIRLPDIKGTEVLKQLKELKPGVVNYISCQMRI